MSILDSVSFVRDYWAETFVIGIAGIYTVKGVGYFWQWLAYRVGFSDRLGFFVGGKWITQYVDTNNKMLAESATLYQRGRSVSGTIKNEVQVNATRKYRVQGSIRGNVLVATYEKKGWRPGIDRGAFTLQLDYSTMRMEGQYCWTDDEGHAPPASGAIPLF